MPHPLLRTRSIYGHRRAIYAHVDVCMCIYVCVYTYIYIYIYIYIYTYVYIWYVYIYIYICIYTSLYIYIHETGFSAWSLFRDSGIRDPRFEVSRCGFMRTDRVGYESEQRAKTVNMGNRVRRSDAPRADELFMYCFEVFKQSTWVREAHVLLVIQVFKKP